MREKIITWNLLLIIQQIVANQWVPMSLSFKPLYVTQDEICASEYKEKEFNHLLQLTV